VCGRDGGCTSAVAADPHGGGDGDAEGGVTAGADGDGDAGKVAGSEAEAFGETVDGGGEVILAAITGVDGFGAEVAAVG
jgi:hypothetical protein